MDPNGGRFIAGTLPRNSYDLLMSESTEFFERFMDKVFKLPNDAGHRYLAPSNGKLIFEKFRELIFPEVLFTDKTIQDLVRKITSNRNYVFQGKIVGEVAAGAIFRRALKIREVIVTPVNCALELYENIPATFIIEAAVLSASINMDNPESNSGYMADFEMALNFFEQFKIHSNVSLFGEISIKLEQLMYIRGQDEFPYIVKALNLAMEDRVKFQEKIAVRESVPSAAEVLLWDPVVKNMFRLGSLKGGFQAVKHPTTESRIPGWNILAQIGVCLRAMEDGLDDFSMDNLIAIYGISLGEAHV